jgi:hypothetical protein
MGHSSLGGEGSRTTPCPGSKLIPDPLHVFDEDLLCAAVVQLGGSTIGVAGNALGDFQ